MTSLPPTPPVAALDPVTRYATEVVAGRVVAGRLVRLACQRHLNDLTHASAKGLVWNVQEAQRVIDFFPTILRLPENVAADEEFDVDVDLLALEGDPFVLSPFQQFIAGSLFGWYTAKGFRRFRIAYIEAAKGSGKTPFGAGLMIYKAVADGTRGAQVFFAATALAQAKIPFKDAEGMVLASPSLRRIFDATVNNLTVRASGSFMRAISSEKKGLDGKRVFGCLIEELHEHPTPLVVQKMRAGIKGLRNALLVAITNSGFDRNSICWHYHEYSRQVLDGTIPNESWFAFVCQLDPCDACLAAGKLQPSDTCARCDDWRVEGPHWLKANPNLGVSLPWEYLREMVREAVDMPSQQGIVKRLNFCIWTEQVTVWIPVNRWALCAAPVPWPPEMFRGRECFIGGDFSAKVDLSSIVFVFPRPLDRALAAGAVNQITRAIDVLPYFWMPAETLQQRAQEDNIPYPEWAAQGFLTKTPGPLVDHDAIVNFVIEESQARGYHVRGIGIDQSGATAVITRLRRHFGEEFVTEVPQGFRMLSGPSTTVEALVFSQNLVHDGNPVMTMCIGNMGKEENHWREIRPVKLSQRKRIDGGLALIDAVHVMERTVDEGVAEDPQVIGA